MNEILKKGRGASIYIWYKKIEDRKKQKNDYTLFAMFSRITENKQLLFS